MRVEETVTYLEMTGPDQLRPGRAVPAVTLELVDRGSPLIRSTHDRIAAPYGWSSLYWSDEQWERVLSDPRVRQWILRHQADVAGLVDLDVQPEGEVEIAVFGLVPEYVGRGIGGHALTLATRLAWSLDPADPASVAGVPAVRRVWLHTSSRDHPNALPNYLSRGFRPFRTEVRHRDVDPRHLCPGLDERVGAVGAPRWPVASNADRTLPVRPTTTSDLSVRGTASGPGK